MLRRTYSATCVGLEVIPITVEVSIGQGVGIYLVGLPDSAVRESLMRVTTAVLSYGYRIVGKKTVINMAPANIKKEGSGYDVAIAVGLLAASEQISFFGANEFLIMGELSLDGALRPIPGALPIAIRAAELGFKACIFPKESAVEAIEVDGITIYGAENFMEVVDILNGELYVESLVVKSDGISILEDAAEADREDNFYDFSDVVGQDFAKRGMEIAAAGNHNLILVGPPGSGKSLMAKCLSGILPKMSKGESLETSVIYSVAGKSIGKRGLMKERPFRCPHHTSSSISLIGGGQNAIPGEISLAHNGVLYLDEISQYPPSVLDVLRQPLEDRTISISRAKYKVDYPASFMLIGSMNPCPCGYAGEEGGRCNCTAGIIARYMSRISGPFMDRIDLHVRVKPVPGKSLLSKRMAEKSEEIAKRVKRARDIQLERFKDESGYTNSQMNVEQLGRYCQLGEDEKAFLEKVIEKFALSARSYGRILKISRTIADLDGSKDILLTHICEAVQYRITE